MRFGQLRKFFHLFAALLFVVQLAGVVYCGDADCLQGSASADCAALICGLLGKHAATNPASGDSSNDSCQCYCHGLIALPKITLNAVSLAATPFHAGATLRLISSPIRSIYHPPLV